MNHLKYLKVLTRVVENAKKVAGQRVASCVVYKGNIYCIGINQYKTHPLQKQFNNEKRTFLHAEIHAIDQGVYYLGEEKLKSSVLYVCRKNAFGLAYSKPCNGCLNAIRYFSIPKVVFTSGPNSFEEFNI